MIAFETGTSAYTGGTPMPPGLSRLTSFPRSSGSLRLLLLLAFAPLACKPVAEPATDDAPLTGRQIYMARCIACHQADGAGIPAICPPLANSPRLTGPPEDLIRILLLGMKGGIVRGGVTYRGIMPAWKKWSAGRATRRPPKTSSPPRRNCGNKTLRHERRLNSLASRKHGPRAVIADGRAISTHDHVVCLRTEMTSSVIRLSAPGLSTPASKTKRLSCAVKSLAGRA